MKKQLSGTVTLRIGGGSVVVLDDGLVWAALIEAEPDRWVVVPVAEGVQFKHEQTGNLLALPDLEPYIQVQADSSAPDTSSSCWVATPVTDEDMVPPDLSGQGGVFTLQPAGTDQYIGRNPVEDRSLLPKRVLLLPPGSAAPLFVVEQVS